MPRDSAAVEDVAIDAPGGGGTRSSERKSKMRLKPKLSKGNSLASIQTSEGRTGTEKLISSSPIELFQSADRDASGHLDQDEFVRLHNVIVGEARLQLSRETAHKETAASERKRSKQRALAAAQ